MNRASISLSRCRRSRARPYGWGHKTWRRRRGRRRGWVERCSGSRPLERLVRTALPGWIVLSDDSFSLPWREASRRRWRGGRLCCDQGDWSGRRASKCVLIPRLWCHGRCRGWLRCVRVGNRLGRLGGRAGTFDEPSIQSILLADVARIILDVILGRDPTSRGFEGFLPCFHGCLDCRQIHDSRASPPLPLPSHFRLPS